LAVRAGSSRRILPAPGASGSALFLGPPPAGGMEEEKNGMEQWHRWHWNTGSRHRAVGVARERCVPVDRPRVLRREGLAAWSSSRAPRTRSEKEIVQRVCCLLTVDMNPCWICTKRGASLRALLSPLSDLV
jgi:hypothetical protein